MPMNTKPILVNAINIMVLAHINAIAIMVGITTPNEVVPPQVLIMGIIVGKEGVAAKNCRREVQALFGQIIWHYGTGLFKDILLDKVPPIFKRQIHEVFLHVPVLIIQARF